MKQVIIWTQEDCPLCAEAKEYFSEDGFEERRAEELLQGNERNVDAMAQLAMQNMQLPLVSVDGEFVDIVTTLKQSGGEAA
jgi:glutaredoxin